MAVVILDTDILSEYLKGIAQNVVRSGRAYAEQHRRFTFTSVTVYEIIRGLEEKGADAQVRKAAEWFRTNNEIVPASEDYFVAAQTKARARRQGNVVELPNCLIAATASRIGLPLVTGNTRHFEAIRETGLPLTLRNWRDD